MDNLHLELSFTTDEPVSPAARIYIKSSSGRDGDPHLYISQDCASSSELDGAINFLRTELENIRRRGNAKFEAERRKAATHP